MHLLAVQIAQLGPFEQVHFPFSDEEGQGRLVTVVHGGGGVGKTTLLSAIASTRPGHAVVPPQAREQANEVIGSAEAGTRSSHVICDFWLGQDDPDRAHVLRVTSPNGRVYADEEQESRRRREQLVFDKLAREGGCAFLYLPSNRWFSRQPIGITSPLRTTARHDPRAGVGLEEATRADLTREVKQALAYAEISASLARDSEHAARFAALARAMRAAVDRLAGLAQVSYSGIDAASFEPVFTASGRTLGFDALPTRARHLVAFAALAVRTLWAAYPGRDPRTAEGVVAIDEVCLHQDPSVESGLVSALRAALPSVQWILTTTSPIVAGSCETREVLALRRLPENFRVELFQGSEARTH